METFDLEQWKDIPDYPNHQASTHGRIRQKSTKKILHGSKTKKGYISSGIDRSTTNHVHCLIAKTWIPNDDPKHKTSVDHINNICDDNRVVNLRWATKSEQSLNRKKGISYGFKRKVDQICKTSGDHIQTFNSIAEAARYLGKPSAVSSIISACKGRTSSALGFVWRYSPDRVCEGELWKPVQDHPKYHISTYGRVRNSNGIINDFVNQTRNAPYPLISICGVSYARHILVGQHFLRWGPDDGLVWNHKDGDTWNPHVDNLERVTQRENLVHAHENGLVSTTQRIVVTHQKTNKRYTFRSMHEASRKFGRERGWVGERMRRENNNMFMYKGYRIEYIQDHHDTENMDSMEFPFFPLPSKTIVATHQLTNKKRSFSTMSDASRHFGKYRGWLAERFRVKKTSCIVHKEFKIEIETK